MATDETDQPQDQPTSGDSGMSDALQNFAHTIQEKAGPPLGADENGASVASSGPIAALRRDGVAGSALTRVQSFLRRQPVVGVVSGIAVGIAIGRRWK